MKKVIFTLAFLVMAYGNVVFAQHKTNLKSMEKEVMFGHYGLRNDDIRPSEANWTETNGDAYRTTYTYDEYDYYLIEQFIEVNMGYGWAPSVLWIYDYDFFGNVLEAMVYVNVEGEWIESEKAMYTYGTDEMEIVYQMMIDDQWVNVSKEVYNYIDDMTTILFWAWNGSNWSSSKLHTYTYSDTSIEVLIQYMQGGAWQNEEKYIYTLDFEGNVTDILSLVWVSNTWENSTHTVYSFSEGVFATKTFDKWYNGTWNEEFSFSFIYEDGNATHGTCMVMDDNNWIPGDGDIEMAYSYNAASDYYYGSEVNVTYIDVTGLKENNNAVGFKVYPNPAKGEISVQTESFGKAEIYNITGQKLMESNVNTFNVSALSQGVYLLKVCDVDGNSETQRIVVK